MRASFVLNKPHRAWRIVCTVLMITCAMSILFVKQHYVIDIPAGILAAEIGIAVSKRMNNERFLWIK